jgi:hypothetical protein
VKRTVVVLIFLTLCIADFSLGSVWDKKQNDSLSQATTIEAFCNRNNDMGSGEDYSLLARLFIWVTVMFLGVGMLLLFKNLLEFESALDSLGADSNLFCYGLLVHFLVNTLMGRTHAPKLCVFGVSVFAFINLYLYLCNLKFMHKIRKVRGFKKGVNGTNFAEFWNTGALRNMFLRSVARGSFPAIVIIGTQVHFMRR